MCSGKGPTAPSGVIPARETVTSYQMAAANVPCRVIVLDGTGTHHASEIDGYYDGGTTLCTASPGNATQVVSGLPSNPKTHDETKFGPSSAALRGNVTRQVRINSSGSATTSYTYDETGQVVSMTDPCGNTTCGDMTGSPSTTYSYTDNSTCTGCAANSAGNSNAYLTKTTNPLGQTRLFAYSYVVAPDYLGGELGSAEDENSIVTKYSYVDPLGRLTLVDSAPGTLDAGGNPAESETQYKYPSPVMDVEQDQSIPGDGVLKSSTSYDGLNHGIKTVARDGSIVETAYDAFSRVCAVSNPTFNDPGPLKCVVGANKTLATTDGYTYFSYDALGRKTLQTQPDSSTQRWVYTGNVVDFYDEDNSHWQWTRDALGRLTKTMENDPGGSGSLTLETDYTYDALDNLLTVNQIGGSGNTARYRTFVYDSLSRLTNACNPEAVNPLLLPCTTVIASGPWSAVYAYDANGNTTTRTDAGLSPTTPTMP